MSRSWSGGSTRGWRRLRASILAANRMEHGGACRLDVGRMCPRHGRSCKDICTGTAEVVHHARGKAYGDDARFLLPACSACNGHVGNPGTVVVEPCPVSRW